ncbi:MAG: ribosome small subunit-dependent GTPase A [Bacteroidetes bacterium HGW-Bacteroidetes-21]|jgi:ribosome biogenesis GTPase|nr:MAG: ribosome small subunit-dependent GTPase A [Bacteroidetes bacterium HGW-Bacteroidetes-21]
MITGIVTKTMGSLFMVLSETGETMECRVRGKIRLEGSRSTSPVVVGDRVDVEQDSKTLAYVISHIHERKNHILRKSINLSKQTHVLAANIDQAVIIATLAFPITSLHFIDRYLVTCEAYQIPALIVFNKTDLLTPEQKDEMESIFAIYKKVGYSCLSVSAETGENLDKLKELLTGKISLLSGHSGVGKSTLINKIEPLLRQKTQEISDYHLKGKHTTTFSEMFPLSEGGFIIDTPGIKGFGLYNVDPDELFHFFPEMFRLTGQCQYNNCTHNHEPGCKIKEAIEKGEVSESRYQSYLQMMFSDEGKHR